MNMREYLSREARRMQAASLRSLPPVAQWPAERGRRLAQYYDMMGVSAYMALTERPPLNVQVTSETQREGYRIRTLAYESLPQLYVTANLYLPDDLSAPAPGVLYLCGHSQQQKVHYQAHPRKFAQLGFVCLIAETIQRGEIEGHHHGPICAVGSTGSVAGTRRPGWSYGTACGRSTCSKHYRRWTIPSWA